MIRKFRVLRFCAFSIRAPWVILYIEVLKGSENMDAALCENPYDGPRLKINDTSNPFMNTLITVLMNQLRG